MSEFKPAVNVSPLIRFGRWSALAAGITYGIVRRSRIAAKEKVLREKARIEHERMAPILAAEKKRISEAELTAVGQQMGVKLV